MLAKSSQLLSKMRELGTGSPNRYEKWREDFQKDVTVRHLAPFVSGTFPSFSL